MRLHARLYAFVFALFSLLVLAPGSRAQTPPTWNNWNNTTETYTDPNTYNSKSESVNGLNLAQFNTILIRWLPDRVEWRVNGQLVRTTLTAVPDEATNIRLNFWAPASGWTDAYSNKLTPAKNARQNQTYYYDVDYVEVRTIP